MSSDVGMRRFADFSGCRWPETLSAPKEFETRRLFRELQPDIPNVSPVCEVCATQQDWFMLNSVRHAGVL
jgi:hypothetical protein